MMLKDELHSCDQLVLKHLPQLTDNKWHVALKAKMPVLLTCRPSLM
jgi:hypothetical protein